MLPREERLRVHKENRIKKQEPVIAVLEESAHMLQLCSTKSTSQQLKGEVFQKGIDWTIATIATQYELPLLPATTFNFLNAL